MLEMQFHPDDVQENTAFILGLTSLQNPFLSLEHLSIWGNFNLDIFVVSCQNK
jgi:hypothetical protein